MAQLKIITPIVFIFSFLSASFAQPSLKWKIFTNNTYSWLCSPSGLQIFSSSSRNFRPVSIDPSRTITFYSDIIEFENYIFVSSDAGLYQIDLSTLGSERIALPDDNIITGKIAIDMDYLWLATSEFLFNFDKLSQEWQTYPLPEKTDSIIGVYSTAEEVFCLVKDKLYRFIVSTEKWNTYKIDQSLTESALFFPGNNSFKIIDNSLIKQYLPPSFSWNKFENSNIIFDIFDEDSIMYFSTESGVMKLASATGALSQVNIPGVTGRCIINKVSDTLIIASSNRITKFNLKNSGMDFIEYPEGTQFSDLEKISVHNEFIIAIYKSDLMFYDSKNRAWQKTPRSGLKQKQKKITWNEEEFKIKYTPGFQSVLTGSIEDNVAIKFKGYEYDTIYKNGNRKINKQAIMGLSSTDPILKATGIDTVKGLPLINLNLRSTDLNDRSIELAFNNTSRAFVPKKGIQYRGNRDDRFNSLKIGSISNDQLSSLSLPPTQIEGGSIIVESKKRVENRDRKTFRLAAGSGYITTRTEWRMLPFRPDGIYYLKERNSLSDDVHDIDSAFQIDFDSDTINKDTLRIIPGSVKVWVDGELFDSTQYTFFSEIGKLQFRSSAPIDPVSSIAIQYKVQTIPDGRINDVEFIPDHNFGLLHYGALTVSPHEYISARVGITGIDSDDHYTHGSIDQKILNFATPLEIRKKNLFFKFTPDFSYNTINKSRAGSATLQSRLGNKAGLVFNGLFMDKKFVSTDSLTYGYGAIQNQYDFTLSYDLTQDVPLSYYQHRREAINCIESRYSAQTGIHIPGFPFLDITLSRNEIDREIQSDTNKTAFDSLFSTKDKIRFRLYETSSKYLEKLTKIRKISYDISHSEYRTEYGDNKWSNGRMSTAEFTISPIQPVSITGNLIYRNGIHMDSMPSTILRPGLEIQTTDAPKGVDINASYYFQYNRYSLADSSTDSITRAIDIILKPGMWFSPLRWFSPRASFSQNVNCTFNVMRPDFKDLLTAHNKSMEAITSGGFGIHIFPTDEILFRNFNEWSESGSERTFSTENDLQIWSGSKNFWQIIWNYTSENQYHDGSFEYDRIITPWLRTRPRISASYITDSLGTELNYGPGVSINLNFQNFKIIKSLFNSHDFKIIWTRRNGVNSNPDIGYTFNLSSVILPNIQISNYEIITFNKNELLDFQSRISLIFNF